MRYRTDHFLGTIAPTPTIDRNIAIGEFHDFGGSRTTHFLWTIKSIDFNRITDKALQLLPGSRFCGNESGDRLYVE